MNPLFQMMGNNVPNANPMLNIIKMLKSGNPAQIGASLMQQNPQFAAFMQQNKGKTPEQVAKENGIDMGQIMGMLK